MLVGQHREIGLVDERIDQQGHVVAAGGAGAGHQGSGRTGAEGDVVGFNIQREADLAGLGHARRVERDGQHLMRRLGIAGKRDEIEDCFAAQVG